MSADLRWLEGFMRMQRWRESIASIALSHHPDCTCDVCDAAHGDQEAFLRVVAELQLEEDRRGMR